MEFFLRNQEFISLPIWELVFNLQDDWDITIKEASIVLVQMCANRKAIGYLSKTKNDNNGKKFMRMFNQMSKGHGNTSKSNLSSRENFSNNLASRVSLEAIIKMGGDLKTADYQFRFEEPKSVIKEEQNDLLDFDLFIGEKKDQSPAKGDQIKILETSLESSFDVQFFLDHTVKTQKAEKICDTPKLPKKTNQIIEWAQKTHSEMQKAIELQGKQMDGQKGYDFFVDEYQDEQIQEIISIFRNDFKPPKSLWIEKPEELSIFTGPDIYSQIYSQAIEQFNQQQLLLQQKQQQELQDQVSGGTSQNEDTPPKQDFTNLDQENFSKTNIKDNPQTIYPSDSIFHSQSGILSETNQIGEKGGQQSNNSQKSEDERLGTDQVEEIEIVDKDENDIFDQEAIPAKTRGDDQKKGKRVPDLNILEQFNFDEMNINLEDINQSRQKQEVINSSSSDIADMSGDASENNNQFFKQHPKQQEKRENLIGEQEVLLDQLKDQLVEYEEKKSQGEIEYGKVEEHDQLLEMFEKKNSQTLQMIEQEKKSFSNYQDEKPESFLDMPQQIQPAKAERDILWAQMKNNQKNSKTQVVDVSQSLKMISGDEISQGQIYSRDIRLNPTISGETNLNQQSQKDVEKKVETDQEYPRVEIKSKQFSPQNLYSNKIIKSVNPSQNDTKTGQALDQPKYLGGQVGSYTQRVGRSDVGQSNQGGYLKGSSTGVNQLQSVDSSKKQFLQNLKQLKTNTEDYLVMQNISNQMGGNLVSPFSNLVTQAGLNSAKNTKVQKSLENLLNEYKKISGKQIDHSLSQFQTSSFPNQETLGVVSKNSQKATKTSREPKIQYNQQVRLSMSPSRKKQPGDFQGEPNRQQKKSNQKSSSRKSKSRSNNQELLNHQRGAKTHRGYPMGQQSDLNRLIQSIETLNKQQRSGEIKAGMANQMTEGAFKKSKYSMNLSHQPTLLLSNLSVKNTMIDPHTPKDVLISLNDQIQQFMQSNQRQPSKDSGSNSNKRKGNKSKSKKPAGKSLTVLNEMQKARIPSQHSQGLMIKNSASLQKQLQMSGYHFDQYNLMLKDSHNQHGSSSREGRFTGPGYRVRSAGAGIFDLTPDSHSKSRKSNNSKKNTYANLRNDYTKSQKSSNSYKRSSVQSVSKSRKGKSKKSQGRKGGVDLFIKTNMQNILLSQHDASSMSSNSKNKLNKNQIKGTRSTSGAKGGNKLQQLTDALNSQLGSNKQIQISTDLRKKNSINLSQQQMSALLEPQINQRLRIQEINDNVLSLSGANSVQQRIPLSTVNKSANSNILIQSSNNMPYSSQNLSSQRDVLIDQLGISPKTSISQGLQFNQLGVAPKSTQVANSKDKFVQPPQIKQVFNNLMFANKQALAQQMSVQTPITLQVYENTAASNSEVQLKPKKKIMVGKGQQQISKILYNSGPVVIPKSARAEQASQQPRVQSSKRKQ